MELKTWLFIVRILNCLSSAMLIGFQIWFLVALFSQRKIYGIILRIFAPIFIILLALLIISAEFKYEKIVENFKFLQWIPGIALFNLLYRYLYHSMASILAFQFSTFNQTASIVLGSIYLGLFFIFLMVNFCKPTGGHGLLSQEIEIVA